MSQVQKYCLVIILNRKAEKDDELFLVADVKNYLCIWAVESVQLSTQNTKQCSFLGIILLAFCHLGLAK